MFGYGTGYIGGILVLPSFNRHFGLDDVSSSDRAAAQSLMVSIWLLGAFIGVISAMPVCSHLGRRKCLVFCALTYVVGALLQLLSVSQAIISFDIGRLLNGIGVGAGTLVAPLYLSEISIPSNKGPLLASWQVSMQIAALVGFWGAYVSHEIFTDESNWQWILPVLVQLLPGTILLFGSIILPESPVWLAQKQGVKASVKAVSWLRQKSAESSEVWAEAEGYHHQSPPNTAATAAARQETSLWKEMRRRPIRKRLICGIGLMTLMTLSGTNALNFFAPIVFMSAGFTSTAASLFLTGLFGLVKLAASLAFMFYFVRVKGHRFWIIVASVICSAALLILAFCVRSFDSVSATQQQPNIAEVISINFPGVLACLMVFVFAFFFGIGHGPIAWNFCAEVFPPHISTKCFAITTCTQWFFQIVNAVATPLLLTKAKWCTWLIFSAVNAFTLVMCMFYIPETRNVPQGAAMDVAFGEEEKMDEEDESGEEGLPVAEEQTPLLA